MDRPSRFSDHPGDHFDDRSGDHFDNRSGERFDGHPGDGGRHSRMPSRWSSGSPTHYPRGRGAGFSSGGRHNPYRAPPQDFPGGGPGSRGGLGGFGHQMPNRRGFHGRGGGSPDYTDGNKFVKLFIGSVPKTATEEDIRPLFEEHGDVIEVALIKDKRTGQPQGCCFVKYATSEEADRAIRGLHNQHTLPQGSGPIQVRYADGERESLGGPEHKLFVASINRQATEKEIEEIFSPFGYVEDVYLMRDEMKQSRGCSFVKFSNREMAAAAMSALNGTYLMRGCDQPLIVRFANPKRPRPGESRPASHLDDPSGGNMPPNAWHRSSPQSRGPPSQGSNPGFGTQSTAKDVATSSVASFNPLMGQVQAAVGQQILPLQKPLNAPQDLPTSLQLHHAQQVFTSNSQAQTLQAPMQQLGQLQVPQSIALPSFNQTVLPQQFPGLVGQLSTSQPLIQQNASASALQTPSGIQQQGMSAIGNQQQLPSSTTSQQLHQQPIQQFPSQLPQVLLQQQTQALQSSYQSSQQAIFQLQQQLHQMQQSSQQQGPQAVKQQSPWAEQQSTSSAPASAPAAVIPSTTSASSVHPVTASVASTCNWTEHTSPEGYKYYYNRVTRESKWEKPEELTISEQQQQQQKLLLLQQEQQKLAAQQLQSPSQTQPQTQVQLSQQLSQNQQAHAQMQLKQQAQLQIIQPTLGYQASGIPSNQNIQDSYYAQLQAASSVIDPARVQQEIQAAQEWAWKNKPAGS